MYWLCSWCALLVFVFCEVWQRKSAPAKQPAKVTGAFLHRPLRSSPQPQQDQCPQGHRGTWDSSSCSISRDMDSGAGRCQAISRRGDQEEAGHTNYSERSSFHFVQVTVSSFAGCFAIALHQGSGLRRGLGSTGKNCHFLAQSTF